MDDADLVARARQGDRTAFGELVDRHRVAVYRAALAALGSHAEAEDIAQDAFLTAYQQLAGFRGEATFKTWLLAIAWHRATNRRRNLTRWWRIVRPHTNGSGSEVTAEPPAASNGQSPEQRAVARELREAILREIRSLSPPLRDTLVLSQTGEYTYEELGAMLNVPVGTIKWRMSEARQTIRRRLRERGYGREG
jgi:RNA polymerase sigma-70 factor (ECF subfamily)